MIQIIESTTYKSRQNIQVQLHNLNYVKKSKNPVFFWKFGESGFMSHPQGTTTHALSESCSFSPKQKNVRFWFTKFVSFKLQFEKHLEFYPRVVTPSRRLGCHRHYLIYLISESNDRLLLQARTYTKFHPKQKCNDYV